MRIEFERFGGFTGIRLQGALNLDELAPEEDREIQDLLEASGFFELPSQITPQVGIPDQFHYRVTVYSAEDSHTIELSDAVASESMRLLLQKLTIIIRASKA